MNCPSAVRKFILCEIMKSQLSQKFHNSSHAAPKMPWQWLVLWWIWPMTITQAARGDCWRPLETCQFLMVKFEFQLFLNFCRRCKSFTCSFDLEKHMQKHAKLYEKQIKSTIWSYALWISLSIFELECCRALVQNGLQAAMRRGLRMVAATWMNTPPKSSQSDTSGCGILQFMVF